MISWSSRKVWGSGMATVLAGSMLLAGCGNSNSNNASSSSVSPTAASTASSKASSAAAVDPVELSIFVDMPWWPFKDWTGPVPEEITKRTGVKLKVTVATDDKQLPLMIASGNLPDLVFTSNQATRMSDPKLSLPWNDLIKQYAPDFQIDQQKIALNTADDGSFYTIKGAFSTQEMWDKYPLAAGIGPGLIVRKDMLEQLGNPSIKSLADLEKVLGMAKDKFPNMIPLVMNPAGWLNTYFASQLGAATDGLVEQDGKLVSYLRQPQLLNTYQYINELYRKGYVTAENFAYKDEQQAKELALSGKAFAYEWTTSGADTFNAQLKGQGQNFEYVQITDNIEPTAVRYQNTAGWASTFISKETKHPAEAIKLMQYLMSEEGDQLAKWGLKDQDWSWNDKGYVDFKYDKDNPDVQKQMGIYYWADLVGEAVYEGLFYYVPDSQTSNAQAAINEVTKRNPVLDLVKPAPDSQEQVILTNVSNMIKNEETRIYLAKSAEEAQSAYNNMIAQADKIGLSKYEAWANKKYGEVQTRFQK
ncbi:hypothetical protein [Cohnella sp. 56]|uniref:hypothetical protein n=1 Tax=Cohnella sp. 56 TaxID=3113722 RepID=UPI0030E98A37